MATTLNITTNYVGEFAGELFVEAFKKMSAIDNGAVTIYEDVNAPLYLRKLAQEDTEQAYSCGFNPLGSITLSEVKLETEKKKVDWELCKEELRVKYGSKYTGISAHNKTLAAEFVDKLVAEKIKDQAKRLQTKIWQATDAVDGWDGFLAKFEADATVEKIDAAATIDKTTVVAEIEKVISAIPVDVENGVLSVSRDIAQAYNFSLIGQGIANGLGGNANTDLIFGNYRLVVDLGLPAKTMVFADTANLAFGTALVSDHNEVSVVDEDEIGLLTGKVRGKMVYSYGTAYVFGAEIVYYRPAVV